MRHLARVLPAFSAVLAALVTPGSASAGPDLPPPRFAVPERAAKLAAAYPEVDRAFAALVEKGETPGAAWGVVVDGALVHHGLAGLRDVAAKAPVEGDTAFRIASMTKSFTAAAVLLLRDEGKLRLDDPVSKWIPELAGAGPTADSPPLTVRDLLTHSEGFPEDNPWGDRQLGEKEETLAAWLKAGIPRSNVPGVAYEYSNYGFALLGQIVAKASGQSYVSFVDARILAPLGMTATRWEVSAVPEAKRARGYSKEESSWVEETPLADGAFGPMGGLVTTVPDIARWVAFQLSAWPPRDDADAGPVKRASLREMQQASRASGMSLARDTPDAPQFLDAGSYGYGLRVSQWCGMRHVVAHTGGLPGWGSRMLWLPEHGVGFVVLANRTYAGAKIAAAIKQAVAALEKTGGLRPRTVLPAPALLAAREGIAQLYGAWDDALAEKLAADNLFLDEPAAKRKAALEKLAKHGACRLEGDIDAENALRGTWRMGCEKGWLEVTATLAPTMPPRVQLLQLKDGLPPGPAMTKAASTVASLVWSWSDASAGALFAPTADSATLKRQLAAVGRQYGTCRPAEVLYGDGTTTSTQRFVCERGSLDVELTLEAATSRVVSATFTKPANATCPP